MAKVGMTLVTDLCLAMRSDPIRVIRGLEEFVTCVLVPQPRTFFWTHWFWPTGVTQYTMG